MRSPHPTRRRARRLRQQGATGQPEPAWLSGLWRFLIQPSTIGALITIAGAVLIASPWLNRPARLSSTWWSAPLQTLDTLMIACLLLAFALPLGAGLWLNMYLRDDKGVDVELTTAATLPKGWTSKLAVPGVLLMILGVVIGVVPWIGMQRDVLPSQAPFAVGQSTEHVVARVGGRPLRLMLPKRIKVSNIKMKAPQEVTFTVSLPKETDTPKQTLKARQSIDVDGKRFTFTGLAEDARNLRVIVAGTSKQSIESTGRVGDKIRVSLNGPAYEVKKIVRNHLGAMGPAVQLQNKDTGTFWVFQRTAKPSLGPSMSNGLRLIRVETLPAAIFTVGPAVPFWPLILAGILFVLGAGCFFGVPHAHAVGGHKRRWFSLNEAGRLAELYAVGDSSMIDVMEEEE